MVPAGTRPSTSQLYAVTFNEKGLPHGSLWNVTIGVRFNSNGTINGTTNSSTTPTVGFLESNGSYAYESTSIDGYGWWGSGWVPRSGPSVTVNGSSVIVTINWTRLEFVVLFTEYGLPPGYGWSVTLNGSTVSSTNSTVNFTVPDGEYSYNVTPIAGWQLLSYRGNTTVHDTEVDIYIGWYLTRYDVAFTETGLPDGWGWDVRIVFDWGKLNASRIDYSEPNGTYTYTVGPVQGWRAAPIVGILTVQGTGVGVSIRWTRDLYKLTFIEAPLPPNTSWGIALNGTTLQTTNSSIEYTLPNWTYDYGVVGLSGWRPTSFTGHATIKGHDLVVMINWTRVTYRVVFSAVAPFLPPGTAWSVLFNGVTNSSTGRTVDFFAPNGTGFVFRVGKVPEYSAYPTTGAVDVLGAPIAQSIAFVWTPGPLSVRAWANVTRTGGGAHYCIGDTGEVGTYPAWENVSFTAAAQNGTGPYYYAWDFGDGTPSYGGSPLLHTYGRFGTWQVHVTAYDSAYAMGSTRLTMTFVAPNASTPFCTRPTSNEAGPTILGLPAPEGSMLLAGIAVGVLVAATVVVAWRRRKGPKAPA